MSTLRRSVIVSSAILVLLGGSEFASGFSLDGATNYAVLYEGGGGNALQINNGPGPGGLAVTGNIGIGGTGALQLSGPVTIDGNIDFAGAVNDNGPYSGNIVVNGSINGNVAAVTNDLNYLNTLSTTLGGETGTPLAISIANGANQTVNASAGTFHGGDSVFTVSAMSFVNGATLTIHGDGVHDVVLNFSGLNPQFGGSIVLTGGLTSDQVLFNVLGGANLAMGSTLQINTNGATETGTFLDPNGAMSINHAILNGRFFGGDSTNAAIVSGAEITGVPEPQTFASLTLGLLGLTGLSVIRHRRTQ
jgi:hypothetical protein